MKEGIDVLLTAILRCDQEVTINRLRGPPQRVSGLQGVVAVVEVSRVPENQTALEGVLVKVHVCSDVLVLLDLLLLVEPAQFGVGVPADREFDAGVQPLLRLSQH